MNEVILLEDKTHLNRMIAVELVIAIAIIILASILVFFPDTVFGPSQGAFKIIFGLIMLGVAFVIIPFLLRGFTISSERISFSRTELGRIWKKDIKNIRVHKHPSDIYVIAIVTSKGTVHISNDLEFEKLDQALTLRLESILKAFTRGKYPYTLEDLPHMPEHHTLETLMLK